MSDLFRLYSCYIFLKFVYLAQSKYSIFQVTKEVNILDHLFMLDNGLNFLFV